jgi:hypothetical protein
MKHVYDNYSKYKEKAIIDSIQIRENFNWDKIANSSASVVWSNVTNKPDDFTPSIHNNSVHSETYITSAGK